MYSSGRAGGRNGDKQHRAISIDKDGYLAARLVLVKVGQTRDGLDYVGALRIIGIIGATREKKGGGVSVVNRGTHSIRVKSIRPASLRFGISANPRPSSRGKPRS